MFATFTSTGSSAAATQTLTGAQRALDRRDDDAPAPRAPCAAGSSCSPSMVVDRRVGAAAGGAGQRDGLARGRPSRRTSSSGLAPTKASSGRADAVAVTGREAGAQGVEDRRRVDRRRARDAHLAGQHDLVELAGADPLDRRAPPPTRSARAARPLATPWPPTGSGSSSGMASRLERGQARAQPLDQRLGDSSPGRQSTP